MPPHEVRARPWRCRSCHIVLGTVDRQAGTLYVTLAGAFVEIGTPTAVHCPCGDVKTYRGRRVVVIATDTRKSA